MDTLLNDIFHAQPDALLMIAGLVFLAIAIVGSVKTYFDPGKFGRIAAGAVGAILLVAGLIMYKPGKAALSAPASQAVAQSRGTPGQSGSTSACYVPGRWPFNADKQMAIGDSCRDASGKPGKPFRSTLSARIRQDRLRARTSSSTT